MHPANARITSGLQRDVMARASRETATLKESSGHASHQEHRRVLHRRHRAAASAGEVAADRRRAHRGARSAGGNEGRRRARRRRQRRDAGPGRRPYPSGVRRMDADPGHHRLDRQLRARRHHQHGLGLRIARARARLRESLARSRDLACGGDRGDHRPRALERRQGACRHRHPRPGHDRGAFRPARRGEGDLRQVHLLSAGDAPGRGSALYAVVPRAAASAPRFTPAACRARASRRCAATISCRGCNRTSPPM